MSSVYLASKSPQRRTLLEQLGLRPVLLEIDVDETPVVNESPPDYVRRIVGAKLEAAMAARPADSTQPVIVADTVIALDAQILGKPEDKAQAAVRWRALSGREHQAISGIGVASDAHSDIRLCTTAVFLRELSNDEFEAYWASGEPQGRAGGYAIQGKGAIFIERIEGSYSNVVGLPLCETARMLRDVGVDVLVPPG